ncbi:MAG: PEP-CTERM sorting domain-containing protein [Burkholderiales bacterium]|nr:PEP-CTERM sorting domain-containing protein [Burkholderiales bacterium]
MRSTTLAAALTAMALSVPLTANAAAVFLFSEVGTDVVGRLTGSLDLTGARLKQQNAIAYNSGLFYSNGAFPAFQLQASNNAIDNQANAWFLESGVIAGTQNFNFTSGSSSGGTSKFEIVYVPGPASDDIMYLSSDYVSDSALDRTLTLSSRSFQSLGIAAGDYVFTLAGSLDTVTLRFQNSSNVPEPGAMALALLALGAAASVRRKAQAHSSADSQAASRPLA